MNCAAPFCTVWSAAFIGTRWLLRTTELIGRRSSSRIKLGTVNAAWYVPIRPVVGVARQDLDDVLARQQREAGFVLDRPRAELARRFLTEPDVQFVADVLHRVAVAVLDLTDEVDECPGGAAALRQFELAAWDLHGDRHEVLGAIELEVVHLHRDRDVGDRVVQHQRFLELPLLVGVGEAAERLVRVVALPIRELARLSSVQA